MDSDDYKDDSEEVKLNMEDEFEIIIDPKQLLLNKKKEDVKNMMGKLQYKIFDVIIIDNNEYFLDRINNYIWDVDTNLIGIINKNKVHLFSEINKLEKQIYKDNDEINNISFL